jgi:hypothetical protein
MLNFDFKKIFYISLRLQSAQLLTKAFKDSIFLWRLTLYFLEGLALALILSFYKPCEQTFFFTKSFFNLKSSFL